MNAVAISGSGALDMHEGDGRSLSGWIKRKAPALFVAPAIGGIDQPVSLAGPAGGSAVAVIRDQERGKKKAQLIYPRQPVATEAKRVKSPA